MEASKKIKIIISIVSISLIQALQFCVTPVLEDIAGHYSDVDISLIQMLMTAPMLLGMVTSLLSGWLVTKFSKKKQLIFAGILAGILGIVPVFCDDFMILFVSRCLYGMAYGIAVTLNTAVVAEFFTGEERIQVMGIQAASVGASMVVVNVVSGMLGSNHFQTAFLVNIIGILAAIVIFICLPETGSVEIAKKGNIRLNSHVWFISLAGLLEMLFLISYSTNISMHISGTLAGSARTAGILSAVFSATQIVIGMILGKITKVTKRATLSVAMFSFTLGTIFLILFPDNLVMLIIGAIWCGISQGAFIPTAMLEVSNCVPEQATAMAAAFLTCGTAIGQLISPVVLNNAAAGILGSVTTGNVLTLAGIGMAIAALFVQLGMKKTINNMI